MGGGFDKNAAHFGHDFGDRFGQLSDREKPIPCRVRNKMENITLKTEQLINRYFTADEKKLVISLLIDECGHNMATLPTGNSKDIAAFLERIRFAALKLSDGDLTNFERAIELANTDWRDLLVSAGFANDINAHDVWADTLLGL